MGTILYILGVVFALAQVPENVEIHAPNNQIGNIQRFFENARATKIGAQLVADIESSSHTLYIQHSQRSLNVAGKVYYKATSLSSNGKGTDVVLKFHFGMPELGSHIVESCEPGHKTFLTALQNFIHELKHARDALQGEVRGHRRELDAVAVENELRREQGIPLMRCLDNHSTHDQIWQVWFDPLPPDHQEDYISLG